MKNLIKLSLIAATLSTSLMATNGINLIGTGAQSRSLGGVGIATDLNGENVYSNPSMITRTKGNVLNVDVTYFSSDVSVDTPTFNPSTGAPTGQVKETSEYPASLIPSIGYSRQINDSFFVGISLYGSGGMGVDYSNAKNLATGLKDELTVATFGIPLAYKSSNDLSFGLTPVLKYGSLEMPTPTGLKSTSSVGYGVEVGGDYSLNGLTIGAVYKTAVKIKFEDVFASGATGSNDILATPSIFGLGLNYVIGQNSISFDYKMIGYGSATGLEDFGWDNQNVFALGYEYNAEVWSVRAGLNYGDTPFSTNSISNASSPNAQQTFGNLMAFPAVTTSHYSVGGSYNIDGGSSFDISLVYALGEETSSINANSFGAGSPSGSITAVNNQISATIGYNYNF